MRWGFLCQSRISCLLSLCLTSIFRYGFYPTAARPAALLRKCAIGMSCSLEAGQMLGYTLHHGNVTHARPYGDLC